MQKRQEGKESWSRQFDCTYGWSEQSSSMGDKPQSRSGWSNCKEPKGGVTLARIFFFFFLFFYE